MSSATAVSELQSLGVAVGATDAVGVPVGATDAVLDAVSVGTRAATPMFTACVGGARSWSVGRATRATFATASTMRARPSMPRARATAGARAATRASSAAREAAISVAEMEAARSASVGARQLIGL
jgi:hypothetical protein